MVVRTFSPRGRHSGGDGMGEGPVEEGGGTVREVPEGGCGILPDPELFVAPTWKLLHRFLQNRQHRPEKPIAKLGYSDSLPPLCSIILEQQGGSLVEPSTPVTTRSGVSGTHTSTFGCLVLLTGRMCFLVLQFFYNLELRLQYYTESTWESFPLNSVRLTTE